MSDIKEITKTKTLEEILSESNIKSSMGKKYQLILWNDEVNDFEHVIICLIIHLKFSTEKAIKTTNTVHISGKEVIKSGALSELDPLKKILIEKGLSVTIEEL